MVNCSHCHKAFRSRIGKDKNTRCERCAETWRKLQLIQEESSRERAQKEDALRQSQLNLKEKELEMERQKVTIKEVLPNGGHIELTCYYDNEAQHKISEVLSGARRTRVLPSPPSRSTTPLPSPRMSLFESRRRLTDVLPPSPDVRRPRRLPTIDGMMKSRIIQRRTNIDEDAGSSAGSGTSLD